MSCSWPAAFKAVIFFYQGEVTEIDNVWAGSEKSYVGKKGRY